ncbi:MAG: DUF1624 domain-containing protein [Alphaproteobacteria bacterium]|nr:DUF1624 domain-containing protein [Alphaproteobacteria bacterium]
MGESVADETGVASGNHFQKRRHEPVKDKERILGRLVGLDLARFVAFVGMVIVNFSVVMGGGGDLSFSSAVLGAFEGRAAATFVALAGIGMGLMGPGQSFVITLKRAAFLLAIGLLNMLIFPADIIHYYAFYFLLGSLFLKAGNVQIGAAIISLVFGFLILLMVLDYDAGWNWETLDYSGFWTVEGFIRNLLFNGWHPVVPWLGFFLFGLLLARLPLSAARMQGWMMAVGFLVLLGAQALSDMLVTSAPTIDGESLVPLLLTKPVPPGPLYMLAGMGAALLAVGACLRFAALFESSLILRLLCAPGRQTLTLYFAHIFVGMGTLQALGLLADQHNEFMSSNTVLAAALLFAVASLLYAILWDRFFRRGPLEALMRRLTG